MNDTTTELNHRTINSIDKQIDDNIKEKKSSSLITISSNKNLTKTVSQLEAEVCEEKVRAILELDAKNRKEEMEKRKEELERRKQSGELAMEEEMKRKAKKQRKLEKKLEKEGKINHHHLFASIYSITYNLLKSYFFYIF